jgi:apolipoprotein N-acyltransferase
MIYFVYSLVALVIVLVAYNKRWKYSYLIVFLHQFVIFTVHLFWHYNFENYSPGVSFAAIGYFTLALPISVSACLVLYLLNKNTKTALSS